MRDSKRDLTRFVIVGETSAGEIIAAVHEYWAGEPTRCVLWDVREAKLGVMPTEQVHEVSAAVLKFASRRGGGRTALVASSDLAFGLSRLFETITTLEDESRPTRVFRDLDEALGWLEGPG